MKTILATLLSLMSFFAISQTNDQFRLVGSGTWSTINDSTYQASLSFMSDLSGGGFLATDIVDSFRLFTGIEKIYRVDTVWNKTFSSASVRVVEYNGTSGIPSGQVMIYNPDGRSTIPQVPFGSTGATAQLQAAVVTYNGKQTATGSGITDGDKGGIDVSASGATWTVDTFAVGTIQIAGDAVTASQIAADAVGSSEIAANAVGSSEIAADAVGNSEMADNAVGSAEIIAESIAAVDIDTGAVTTSEILDGTVAWGDLAGAVQDSIPRYQYTTTDGFATTSPSKVSYPPKATSIGFDLARGSTWKGATFGTRVTMDKGSNATSVASDVSSPFTWTASTHNRTLFQPSASKNDAVSNPTLSSEDPGEEFLVCFENLTGSTDTVTWGGLFLQKDLSAMPTVILSGGDYVCYSFSVQTVAGTASLVSNDDIGGGSGSGISGLTSGKVPKATSSTTIGDGLILDNGTTVSVEGSGKFLAADNGGSLKGENLYLERANNATGAVIANMTIWPSGGYTIPAGANDLVHIIANNTGKAFTVDPNSTETIGGASTMSLIDGERLILVYNSAATDWMILGGKQGDVSRINDKYWNSTGAAYYDTAWVASYSPAKQQIVRKGLLDEFELPQLPYSVPVPDTVFSNLLNKYNWKIDIIEDAAGARVQTNINTDIFKMRESYEVPYYVDVLAGNDSNSGLTEALAWKTLDKAISTSGAKHIWVKPGVYAGVNSFNSKNVSGDKVIRRMGGKQGDVVVVGGINTNTWTLKAGAMYVTGYSAIGALDKNAPKNADSTFIPLTIVADTATCRATPGSWVSFNSFQYVHLFDDAAPGTGRVTLVVSSADNGAILIPSTVTATVFVEGIDFYGLGRSVVTNYNSSLIFKNCRKVHSDKFTTNTISGFIIGSTVAGAGLVILDGCEAYNNSEDGFSYGNMTGSTFRILELNCTGYSNYNASGTSVDGSSIHQKCSVLRIGGGKTLSGKPGGYYYDNGNSGIHDTGLTGPARVWNVGISCYNQRNLNISGVDMYMGGSSTTGLKTYHTLCNVPLNSTSSLTWYNYGSTTTELRWCYPATTGAPSLGTTSGTFTVVK